MNNRRAFIKGTAAFATAAATSPFVARTQVLSDADGGLNLLTPQPVTVTPGTGVFALGASGFACFEGADTDVKPALERLGKALGSGWELRAEPLKGASIRFRIVPGSGNAQGYRLTVGAAGILAEARDRAGLFYAAVTLAHLVRLFPKGIPACAIDDRPDFPARGVLLDISRDKVPSMETLFHLVDWLSDLKINQLQLYTEHTFAYRGHEEVWRDASPMTADEIKALDARCRSRCVDLVPNQASFAHLGRWLTRPNYAALAEGPRGGSMLCPTDPRSVAFLAALYDDLLPNFTSRFFNVNCDETQELEQGKGRSAETVKQRGAGRVYLDFLKQIHALAAARGRTMMFWGDIILRHPELIPELPSGALALAWGYEGNHPFDAQGAKFAASKIPFYVCPGTSSWNSLAGRTYDMRENLRNAAEHGLKHGACGFLNTDWGDGGHWQPLAVSLAGFACGAALSWNFVKNRDVDLAAIMNALLAEGRLGQTLLELGDVYRLCGVRGGNGTELGRILSGARTRPVSKGVTAESLQAVLARVDALAEALPAGRTVLSQETAQVVLMLRAACHRGQALLNRGIDSPETRKTLWNEMENLMAGHARVWRLRNREGGLSDSLARFRRIRDEYGT